MDALMLLQVLKYSATDVQCAWYQMCKKQKDVVKCDGRNRAGIPAPVARDPEPCLAARSCLFQWMLRPPASLLKPPV